ncbi:MAG: single-stranded DNA-binding protein [Treponemataceae bacterium]|nr:single-stranded DNA-binding protein [Treponemataceae bacterium]
MNPLNSILIEGNVVRDAVLDETTKGTKFSKFSIAANRCYKSETGSFETEVSFFDVETWGKLAELCSENCTKGRGVRIVGRLKQGRWTDSSGNKLSKIGIIAEHVEFKPVFKQEKTDKNVKEPVSAPNAFSNSKSQEAEMVVF